MVIGKTIASILAAVAVSASGMAHAGGLPQVPPPTVRFAEEPVTTPYDAYVKVRVIDAQTGQGVPGCAIGQFHQWIEPYVSSDADGYVEFPWKGPELNTWGTPPDRVHYETRMFNCGWAPEFGPITFPVYTGHTTYIDIPVLWAKPQPTPPPVSSWDFGSSSS